MSATSQAIGAPEQATAQPNRPRSSPFTNLRLHLGNIYRLMIKELRGIRSDPIMLLLLVAYSLHALRSTPLWQPAPRPKRQNLSVGIDR